MQFSTPILNISLCLTGLAALAGCSASRQAFDCQPTDATGQIDPTPLASRELSLQPSWATFQDQRYRLLEETPSLRRYQREASDGQAALRLIFQPASLQLRLVAVGQDGLEGAGEAWQCRRYEDSTKPVDRPVQGRG